MNPGVEIRNLLTVKGQGTVAIAYLRQGDIRVGQQTQPLALDAGPLRVLTLAAVIPIHSPDGGRAGLGLVFRERPSLKELRLALAPGTLLLFEDATDTGTCSA